VPFAIDSETATRARQVAPPALAPIARLRRLSSWLLDAHGIAGQPSPTTTAAQAFHDRRANCVAYAALFVGLAREVAVPAYFVLVDDLPSEGTTVHADALAVTEGHLAAAYGAGDSLRVFDLAGETVGTRLRVRAITDIAAIAVFYSNRGVEALIDGDADASVAWLRAAAELEPTALPSTWLNLGVALRRTGDLEGARAAYDRALSLDPMGAAAYRNLAALLALRGQARDAAALVATLDELPHLDSLHALELARERLLAGHVQEARGLYSRALDLARTSPPR
jgi:tetratricopeptide (TPR) repeat protein